MLTLLGLALWLLPVALLPDPMPENWRWRDWVLTLFGFCGVCLVMVGVFKWGLFLLLWLVHLLASVSDADWIHLWGLF